MVAMSATAAEPTFPAVSVMRFLTRQTGYMDDCRYVADAFERMGVLAVHDPRLDWKAHARLQDMMLRYFQQSEDLKLRDERTQYHHEVGYTPPRTELTRYHDTDKLASEQGFIDPATPVLGRDPKVRFMWRAEPDPNETAYAELHGPQVVPEAFQDEWVATIDAWIQPMMETMRTAMRMLAVGFGIEDETFFVDMLSHGPHLFAPTGANLSQHHEVGTMLAGVHRDIGFLTGHGPSNAPGLFVWTRDGRRIPAILPPEHLLLQAAQQLEYVTGGRVLNGFHEVVTVKKVLELVQAATELGVAFWRASTTVFMHRRSDDNGQPEGIFATPEALKKYPPVRNGDQVLEELGVTGVAAKA